MWGIYSRDVFWKKDGHFDKDCSREMSDIIFVCSNPYTVLTQLEQCIRLNLVHWVFAHIFKSKL